MPIKRDTSGGGGYIPTPIIGVFGQCARLWGTGTRADPFKMQYVYDHSNFNASPLTLLITLPDNPKGRIRVNYFGCLYNGTAAGVRIQPYINLNSVGAGTGNAMPLGTNQITTYSSEEIIFDDAPGLVAATGTGLACVNSLTPFKVNFINYAATDDVYFIMQFDYWTEE